MVQKVRGFLAAVLLMVAGVMPAAAQASGGYIQCAPFAREISGIDLYGRAANWWSQAEGRYARGNQPQVGAVLSFRSMPAMPAGHVAMVTGVVDSRTITITHANWSVINGRRGQVERDVRAIDVSPANDWTQVRVWYAPVGGIGIRAYPTDGFIYRDAAPAILLASAI